MAIPPQDDAVKPPDEIITGTRKITRVKTLKDGTIKTYTYDEKFTKKTDRKTIGKKELQDKIIACKDKEKIDKLKQLAEELGM